MAYEMAGVTEPRKQIHIAEPYDPFDYKELHHLEGLMLFDKGKAPEAAAAGVTARDGDLPCCPSGGLLGVGNPIAAAGLMKVAELFWQLRGEAGARQVPGTPERGVAQAWGDLMQVGTVVVMGAFLDGLQDGRIVAAVCSNCGRTLVPPRKFCERCFRPTDSLVDVAGTGAVETFSVCYVRWDMVPLDPPEIPAVIRLDGASQ